jgi:hypothetical protein
MAISRMLQIVGEPFLAIIGNEKRRRLVVECLCVCGTRKRLRHDMVISGHVKSCGCLVKDKEYCTKHGYAKTKLYGVFKNMHQRCNNPSNPGYFRYGGRGITICYEWQSFDLFLSWALENGYREGLSLEREHNDGNYEPSNCFWATDLEQMNNTRRSRRVTAFGETKSLSQWSRDSRCKVSKPGLRKRLNNGIDPEIAISSPPSPKIDNIRNAVQ